jgi:hypothetical protein
MNNSNRLAMGTLDASELVQDFSTLFHTMYDYSLSHSPTQPSLTSLDHTHSPPRHA